LISNHDSLNSNLEKYIFYKDVKSISNLKISNVFDLNGSSWLIIDSVGVYPKKTVDYIVLYNNPQLNLDRLIHYTQPKQIIIHNKNYQNLIGEYIEYFEAKKIPYYNMRTKGSFVLNYISNNKSSADL